MNTFSIAIFTICLSFSVSLVAQELDTLPKVLSAAHIKELMKAKANYEELLKISTELERDGVRPGAREELRQSYRRQVELINQMYAQGAAAREDAAARKIEAAVRKIEAETRKVEAETRKVVVAPTPVPRGPIHEAYASASQATPTPGAVVTKAPPKDVEEMPAAIKPPGKNVVWISGYWAVINTEEDHLWVSGVWRKQPPGREWTPGEWVQTNDGYRWVQGSWLPKDSDPDALTKHLDVPRSLEAGPNQPAAKSDSFWIPGVWQVKKESVGAKLVSGEDSYKWQPGGWWPMKSQWVWTPPSYVWTPEGSRYLPGHWDYPWSVRGQLHVSYEKPTDGFTPQRVPAGDHFTQLWTDSATGGYYYGDYHDADRPANLVPWHHFHEQNLGFDPLYNYYSVSIGPSLESGDFCTYLDSCYAQQQAVRCPDCPQLRPVGASRAAVAAIATGAAVIASQSGGSAAAATAAVTTAGAAEAGATFAASSAGGTSAASSASANTASPATSSTAGELAAQNTTLNAPPASTQPAAATTDAASSAAGSAGEQAAGQGSGASNLKDVANSASKQTGSNDAGAAGDKPSGGDAGGGGASAGGGGASAGEGGGAAGGDSGASGGGAAGAGGGDSGAGGGAGGDA